jgi:hypothetical protein
LVSSSLPPDNDLRTFVRPIRHVAAVCGVRILARTTAHLGEAK